MLVSRALPGLVPLRPARCGAGRGAGAGSRRRLGAGPRRARKVSRHARQLRSGRGGCADLAARGRPGSAGAVPRPDRRRERGPPERRGDARRAAARRRSHHQREAGKRSPLPGGGRLRPGRHGDGARPLHLSPRRARAVCEGLRGPREAVEPVRRGGRRRRHAPGRDRQLPGDDQLGPVPVSAARGRASPRPGRRGGRLHGVCGARRSRAGEPRGALASEPRRHAARPASRRRAGEAPPLARPVPLEDGGAALHRRRPCGRCRHQQHGRRNGRRRLRRRRPARHRPDLAWTTARRRASIATAATGRSRIGPRRPGCRRRSAGSTPATPTTTTTAISTCSSTAAAGRSRCATRCCATTATAASPT